MAGTPNEAAPRGWRARVPPQASGKTVTGRAKPLPASLPVETPGKFRVIRIVANIELVDEAGAAVVDFDPPIELNVDFTEADARAASGGYRSMRLAYYDSASGQWNVIGRPIFTPASGAGGGSGKVFLKHWPADPPLGWGE